MSQNLQQNVSPPKRSFKFEDLIDIGEEFHEEYCEKIPSTCFCEGVQYIYACTPNMIESENRGYWLLFPNSDNVDQTWDKVKTLLAANRLGPQALVSVGGHDTDEFLILVYTNDYKDVQDVFRVLVALRRSHIETKNYKTEMATMSGVFRSDEAAQEKGFSGTTLEPGRRVSMYHSPRSLINDPTGATENILLLKNNIGPEFQRGLIVQLDKKWYDTEPTIVFYDPPRMCENSRSNYRSSNPNKYR